MSATSLVCRCGTRLRLPDRKEVVAQCPSCGRTIDFLANELPVKKLDRKAYKRLFRASKDEEARKPQSAGWTEASADITAALGNYLLERLFWVVSGVCIVVMGSICLYYFSLTFEPSDAQMTYELAMERRLEGEDREARILLQQVVEQAPKSRWAVLARNTLAEIPGGGLSVADADPATNATPEAPAP